MSESSLGVGGKGGPRGRDDEWGSQALEGYLRKGRLERGLGRDLETLLGDTKRERV